MPVIEGADLTSVSTSREPYPEGEYLITYKESEITEDGKTCIIKSVIDEPAEFAGREWWDFVNLVQNDGKRNEIGLGQIKKHIEAVYGKGSPEAESSPPDTDVLNGHQSRVYLTQKSFKNKAGEDQMGNKTKKIFRA